MTQPESAAKCCVCGSTEVAYHNYREKPFCWPCADGRGPNAPAQPEPPPAREALREQYATAISRWHRDPEQPLYLQGADAVLAVRDAETDRLRREVDTLRDVCESNQRAYTEAVRSAREAATARDAWAAEAATQTLRAEQAETAIARVRALHTRWDADPASCAHCVDSYGTPVRYPCPTLLVVDGTT